MLGTLALASVLGAGCRTVQDLWRLWAPGPGTTRAVRIAAPNVAEYRQLGERVRGIGKRIAPERRIRVEVVPLSLNPKPGEAERDLPPTWKDLPGRYAAALNSGAHEVDLAVVDAVAIQALGQDGALHDLTPLLRTERWFQTADFWGNVLQAGQVRGKQVAIPLETSVEVLLYNRRLFDLHGLALPSPGWTWDDFLAAAKKLTDPRATPPQWGFVLSAGSPSIFSLAWQHGATPPGPDAQLTDLTEPGAVRALEFLADLVHLHRVAAPPSPSPRPVTTPPSGMPPSPLRRAFFNHDDWFPPRLVFPSNLALEYHAMATTFCTDGTSATWWRAGAYTTLCELPTAGHNAVLGFATVMLGVPRGAPDLEHSVNALRALLDASDQAAMIPARRQSDDFRKIDNLLLQSEPDALRTTIASARFLPGDVPLSVVLLIQQDLITSILRGEKAPQAAAKQVQSVVQRRLTPNDND